MPEELTLTTDVPQGRLRRPRRGQDLPRGVPTPQRVGRLPRRTRAETPSPTGDTGVGGIKFAPLDCKDEDLREWKIAGYGIEQLQKKHDKPFFLACGLHKPHMPWNVPRKYYDMHPLDKIELPPHRETDLDDVPPAGVRMARPEGDHAQDPRIGPLEGGRPGLPRRHLLLATP